MISTRKESDEVLYAADDLVLLQAVDLAELKRLALLNPRKRIRICSHKDTGDPVHEMFIVHTWDTYVRPHKHLGKAESFSILEGLVDLVLFHDDGEIRQVIRMGAPESGLAFYYRLSDPIFHTLLIRSEFLVFHEVTQGPFQREQTEFAGWSTVDLDLSSLRQADAALIVKQMMKNSV
jgi:cupin fold WbuC family metalloprotein